MPRHSAPGKHFENDYGTALSVNSRAKTGQSGKSMKEALMEQSAIFQTMPTAFRKTARAVELFGRSGTAMIPLLNQGPKAL